MTLRTEEDTQFKEEALDRSMWRERFGRGFEPVVRLLDDDDITLNCLFFHTYNLHVVSSSIQ